MIETQRLRARERGTRGEREIEKEREREGQSTIERSEREKIAESLREKRDSNSLFYIGVFLF